MHGRIAPATLVIAAAMALAACGGSDQASTSPSPATTSSSAPAPSPTPTPTPTSKAYTNDELTSIVAGLKDAQGQSLTVVPAAQIDQGLIASRELLKTAVITPKACGVMTDSNTQIPKGSAYAAGTSLAAAARTVTVVTVFGVKDAAAMAAQFEKSKATAGACSKFTIEVQGQQITSETTPLEAAVQADVTNSALVVQTLPTGQKQAIVTVTGINGTLAATAAKTGPVAAVTAASAPELVKLVNAALAAG